MGAQREKGGGGGRQTDTQTHREREREREKEMLCVQNGRKYFSPQPSALRKHSLFGL